MKYPNDAGLWWDRDTKQWAFAAHRSEGVRVWILDGNMPARHWVVVCGDWITVNPPDDSE